VIVVSRGDDTLLDLGGRPGWHFPQDPDGTWAGSYPADSEQAIVHLETLRARGGDFLLFPSTAFWWLEHYHGFREHLEERFPVVHRDACCVIYALREPKSNGHMPRGDGTGASGERPAEQERSSSLARPAFSGITASS
jgi:hypothetical protein